MRPLPKEKVSRFELYHVQNRPWIVCATYAIIVDGIYKSLAA